MRSSLVVAQTFELTLNLVDAGEPSQRVQPDGARAVFGQLFEVPARMGGTSRADATRVHPGGLYSVDGRCSTRTTCVPEEVQVRHRHAAAGRGTDREAIEGRARPSQDEREANDEA